MIFITTFILAWTTWIIFSDKRRIKEILPVSVFAVALGAITDTIVHHYKLWSYHSKIINHIAIDILDELGIYIVVTYLFIQFLPREKSFKNMFIYIFKWSTFAIIIEFIHLKLGNMKHHKFWNLGWSYLCDWILFLLFYSYHEILGLKKLSLDNNSIEINRITEIENLGDIVFALDKKGRVIDCHSNWLLNHNINPSSVIGKTMAELNKNNCNNLSLHHKAYERVLEGESVFLKWDFLTNEKVYHFQSLLSPFKNDKNEIVGIVGIDNEIVKEKTKELV